MTDARRPLLHHTPRSGWVNDPVGVTYHEGRYHLFFQYVPGRTTWDVGCHWGHATSTDLLHWTAEPVALSPQGEEDGVWSGGLVVPADGPPTIFYTGVSAGDIEIGWVRRAVALDGDWRTWRKEDVVVRLPVGEAAVAFRDPYVYRDAGGDGWRMLVGGGLADGRPATWMFASPDLLDWSFAGRAAVGVTADESDGSTGSVWECPMLIRLGGQLGGRSVLVVADGELGRGSHASYAWVTEEGDRLGLSGPWRRLSYGPSYYAATPFLDADGRTCLMHWLRGVADLEAGWAGAHSVPHLLERDDDLIVARPHPVVAAFTVELGAGTHEVEEGVVVALVPDDGGLVTVRAGDDEASMPWSGGPVQALVDGPVIEVFGREGVLALPVPSVSPVSPA